MRRIGRVQKKEPVDEALRRWAEMKALSPFELVGMILARAQLLEELMRMEILRKIKRYSHPRQIKGTFGVVKSHFKKLYPTATILHEALDDANEVRNSIAHDSFLISWFLEGKLKDHPKKYVDHFNHKTLEKHLHVVDNCLVEFMKFRKSNPILMKKTRK